MKNRFGRKLALAVALAGAFAMTPGTAWADGTQTPTGAPTVQIGVPTFGDNSTPNTGTKHDYYRLPNLLAQDVVTVAVAVKANEHGFCLAGGIDDFNWSQNQCNNSDSVKVRHTGARFTLTAKAAKSPSYLQVYKCGTCLLPGPYQFTVEKIQHRLALSIPATAQVKRNGQITVRTHLTNGAGAANGHKLSLAVIIGGRSYNHVATVSGGRAVFQLNLPAGTEGKTATLKASSSSSSATYTGASVTGSTRVVK